jgi:tetratricopeptide (TPR) repeat protein
LPRDLLRIAAEVAARAGHPERALALAQQAVSPGSRDYRDHVWLSAILAAVGRQAAAEDVLRHAVFLGGGVPDPWVALVGYLARTDQPDKAEAALQEMKSRLAPDRLPLALAQGYEALGNQAAAEEQYRAALAAKPNDFLVLHRAADFYLHHDRPRQAEAALRGLLDPGLLVPQGTLAWARRQLALLLAAQATEERVREALALLDQNRVPGGETVADERARAFVQAARPGQRKPAIRLVEESVERQPLAPDERFRLAQLYEAENDWPRAGEHLRALLAADRKNTTYLDYYIRGLLRHGQKEEARAWVMRLEQLEPGSPRTKAFRADLARATKPKPGSGPKR